MEQFIEGILNYLLLKFPLIMIGIIIVIGFLKFKGKIILKLLNEHQKYKLYKFAEKAVIGAEMLWILSGSEKYSLALQNLYVLIAQKYGKNIAEQICNENGEKLINHGVYKLKERKQEIKKENMKNIEPLIFQKNINIFMNLENLEDKKINNNL